MWKIDTNQNGSDAVMRKYQYEIIEQMLDRKKDVKTLDIYCGLRARGFDISRASCINFLEKLADNGVITRQRKEAGKGGWHRVYAMKLNKEEIIEKITMDTIGAIKSAFPDSNYLLDLMKIG